jgi:hypothetical protein
LKRRLETIGIEYSMFWSSVGFELRIRSLANGATQLLPCGLWQSEHVSVPFTSRKAAVADPPLVELPPGTELVEFGYISCPPAGAAPVLAWMVPYTPVPPVPSWHIMHDPAIMED